MAPLTGEKDTVRGWAMKTLSHPDLWKTRHLGVTLFSLANCAKAKFELPQTCSMLCLRRRASPRANGQILLPVLQIVGSNRLHAGARRADSKEAIRLPFSALSPKEYLSLLVDACGRPRPSYCVLHQSHPPSFCNSSQWFFQPVPFPFLPRLILGSPTPRSLILADTLCNATPRASMRSMAAERPTERRISDEHRDQPATPTPEVR